MNANDLLQKLRARGPQGPMHSLAGLAVDALLDQKLEALVPKPMAIQMARAGLEGWLRTPASLQALTTLVDDIVNGLRADRRTLGQITAKDIQTTTKALLSRPWSPDRSVVMTVLDREPMRELVRGLLLQTVLDFARKASAPVAGVAKGLGSLARFAAETAKSSTGTLGSLVGAVTGEVERQVEKRAVEVVNAALGGVMGEIADAVSDPKRAKEAVALRLAIYDGVLELTLAQLSRELLNLDVPGGAQVLRDGLERWLASPDAAQWYEQAATVLTAHEGQKTLRQVLEESGQLQTVRQHTQPWLAGQLEQLVQTDAFEAWLATLMA